MEEQIKRTSVLVRNLYILFWLFPLLGIIVGEWGGAIGSYAGNAQACYWGETSSILLTALCVPVALKIFSWGLTRQVNRVTLPIALRLYVFWSVLRLLLLLLPIGVGIWVYYAMLSTTGILCALIGLTASLFCLPGEGRLRSELQIDKE